MARMDAGPDCIPTYVRVSMGRAYSSSDPDNVEASISAWLAAPPCLESYFIFTV